MFAKLRNWLGDEDYRAMMLVILGGLIGGIGAVALLYLQQDRTAGVPSTTAQAASIMCGPIAALVAVIFILNTERSDTLRLLVLAILCGLQGPAILVGGANLILRLINQAPVQWDYVNGELIRPLEQPHDVGERGLSDAQ